MTLLILLSTATFAGTKSDYPASMQYVVDIHHADKFSKLIVQDYKGRMKPVHTMSREILRKLARKESINGLSAEQVVLGMFVNSREWHTVPMIKLGKHETIREKLG